MISRYETVELNEVAVGTLLGADLLDHQGAVLLPKGALLTDAMLGALRRRGVGSVQVQSDRIGPEQLARERARVLARLDHLFRHSGQSPAAAVVLRELSAYRLRELE